MKKKNWVTIQQVAQHAGVSPMTVSRYLKNKDLIKAKSATAIDLAIKQTGYLPNKMAGILAGGESHVIGIVIPTLSISMFRNVLDNISGVLSSAKLELIVAVTDYDPKKELDAIHNFLGWRVKGLILTGVHQSPDILNIIAQSNTPCIHVTDTDVPEGFNGIAIGCSHYQGGYDLGQYMVNNGYKRCAYMSTDMAFLDYRNNNRYQGFVDGVTQAGGTVSDKINIGEKIDVSVGYNSVDYIDIHNWDGILFPSDELATGAVLGLLKKGVKIPDNIAVCGYHGSVTAQYLPVSITSYAISWDTIGRLVLDTFTLLWHTNPPVQRTIISVPAGIVKGKSC